MDWSPHALTVKNGNRLTSVSQMGSDIRSCRAGDDSKNCGSKGQFSFRHDSNHIAGRVSKRIKTTSKGLSLIWFITVPATVTHIVISDVASINAIVVLPCTVTIVRIVPIDTSHIRAAKTKRPVKRMCVSNIIIYILFYDLKGIIAVPGQFKGGKSTLRNALIGEPILPAGVVPLTAAPTFIQFGRDTKNRGEIPGQPFKGRKDHGENIELEMIPTV
jgi:hypothetical protein